MKVVKEIKVIKVVEEINGFDELLENSWGGAKTVLKQIKEKGREEELMDYLDKDFSEYYEDTPTKMEVNDFIWFYLPHREGWEDLSN